MITPASPPPPIPCPQGRTCTYSPKEFFCRTVCPKDKDAACIVECVAGE